MAPSGELIRVFVTVGSQLPFDRLVLTVAHWVRTQPSVKAVAQIGASALQRQVLEPMELVDHLAPRRYAQLIEQAHFIVAHAGVGSILTAIEHGKPMVMLPRRGHLHETRTDHQFDTALHLLRQQVPGAHAPLRVALDEEALPSVLNQTLLDLVGGAIKGSSDTANPLSPSPSPSHAALIQSLRRSILSSRLH